MEDKIGHWHCNNCETDNSNNLNECEVCGAIPPLFIDFSCVCHDVNSLSLCKCRVDKADALFLQIDENKPFELFKNEIALNIKKPTILTLIATNKITERRKSIKVEIEKPSIHFFEVSEKSVLEGASVSVRWKVLNAETCAINGLEKGCEGEENIRASKELTIKATNSAGEVSQPLRLTILPRPTISIKASKKKLHADKGERVALTWDVNNAETCSLITPDGTSNECKNKDSIIVTPTETSIYTLRIIALDKKTIIDTPITIEVYPDAEVQINSDKEYVFPSIPFTLSWQVKNAKQIKLNGEYVKAVDSLTYTDGIEKNTTYTLSVTDEFGTKDYPLTIKMLPIPQVKTILVPTPHINETINITANIPIPQIINVPYVKNALHKALTPRVGLLKQKNKFKNNYWFNSLLDKIKSTLK